MTSLRPNQRQMRKLRIREEGGETERERVRKAEEMMLDEVPEQQSRDGLLSRVGASLRVQTGAVCTQGQLADTTGPCLPWPSAECGLPHRPEEMG